MLSYNIKSDKEADRLCGYNHVVSTVIDFQTGGSMARFLINTVICTNQPLR
jgi:hypothetical protein